MNKRTVVLTIILFALIVGGMFMFAYLKKSEVANEPEPVNEQPEEEVAYASITRIDAKHFYADGTHTLVGEVPMPTPCDLLEADATVAESMPEQVTVNFTVVNNSSTCAQVITPARFKVEVEASEEAQFSAVFAGREVELNLIPAAEGETPDDFEVFIKG